jgi:hypothetical chaperone protein
MAGFDEVSFLEEPAAAAMHYHQQLRERQTALIVDIGGGTTDVAYADLGGGIEPRIHRSWGLPKGGTDLDVGISMHTFMPFFGKDISDVPVHHYVDAASVHNLPKQREFRSNDYRLRDEPFASRLRALQQLGATTRLNQLAEGIKIRLSTAGATDVALGFIEDDLQVHAARADFDIAAEPFLTRLQRTLREVRDDASVTPASIFLTGGTSRSPQVQASVAACFEGVTVVPGDPSLGVVSGLAVAAAQ